MFGTIVHFKANGCYGFIRHVERPADIFFHASEFAGDPRLLELGATVEFELGERKGKTVARDIRLLESGASDAKL